MLLNEANDRLKKEKITEEQLKPWHGKGNGYMARRLCNGSINGKGGAKQ